MEYVNGKQAQIILKITTRQGLNKIVKNNNIEIKSQGAGKPNLYLKSDIEKINKKTSKNREKYNPTLKSKVEAKEKTISEKKESHKKNIENKPEVLKPKDNSIDLESEDFNPLNKIGQDEFLRIEKLLTENGTYEEIDRSLLLFYSISYQKYINSVTQSAMNDDTTIDDYGNVKIHPHFLIADKCFKHMNDMAKQLGIGVRSRVGLEIKREKKKGIMDILSKEEEF